jgi:4-diphosphocytidyl-2-C-methyl-D-erythritol kinase
VPFALLGGTALGTGRGELVTPVSDANTWWWVVVPAEAGLSTPDVYRHFDRMFPDAPAAPVPADALLGAIAAGDAWALADALHNDLEAAAVDLRPELGKLIETGESAGALRGMVSGSGPTCVFLCGSADHARSFASELAGAGHPVVLAANGPVAGAHLVSYA